jgi:hypothetical protein
MGDDSPKEFTKKEVAERRDEALKRALNTPPRPHTSKEKNGKSRKRKKRGSESG